MQRGRVVVGGRQKRVLHALFEDHPPWKGDATKSVHDHSYGHDGPSAKSKLDRVALSNSVFLPLR